MSNSIYGYAGFQDLEKELKQYIDKASNPIGVLETGAIAFVNDLKRLPKPMSKIHKAGYTHLINSFAYRKKSTEVEVGWGKYYGPMVENGTKKMDPHSHVSPLWDLNRDKYYRLMLMKLGF